MKRFFYTLHAWGGILLSALFLMWFVSGIVMIYHGYPRWTDAEALRYSPPIDHSKLPSPDSLAHLLNKYSVDTTTHYSLQLESNLMGETFFRVTTPEKEVSIRIDGDTLSTPNVNYGYLQTLASRWQSDILRVDTLHTVDQWTPFSRLKEDLPFYRIILNDGEVGRWLYVSSRTGRILSESTSEERLWAYFGAIPHWIYPTILRQDADLWKQVVIVLSGLGSIMILAGCYAGIDRYVSTRKQRNKRSWQSPYKKSLYRWHHILGTVSGLFIFAWVFSGMMSVVDIPEGLSGVPKDKPRITLNGTPPPPHTWTEDYRNILHRFPEAKRITWDSFADSPLIRIEGEDTAIVWDVREKAPLNLSMETVVSVAQKAYKMSPTTTTELTEYDGYYIDRRRKLSLPVYRLVFDDDYDTALYVNPATAEVRIVDRRSRLSMWTYKKLHTMAFSFLVQSPTVWTIVMWILLLAGTVVSLTGLILGIKFVQRKWKRFHS